MSESEGDALETCGVPGQLEDPRQLEDTEDLENVVQPALRNVVRHGVGEECGVVRYLEGVRVSETLLNVRATDDYYGQQVHDVHSVDEELDLLRGSGEAHDVFQGEPEYTGGLYQNQLGIVYNVTIHVGVLY